MKTELIICPDFQSEVFEADAMARGVEIISKRPDGFDNYAYEVCGEAVYNEEWQSELSENLIDACIAV